MDGRIQAEAQSSAKQGHQQELYSRYCYAWTDRRAMASAHLLAAYHTCQEEEGSFSRCQNSPQHLSPFGVSIVIPKSHCKSLRTRLEALALGENFKISIETALIAQELQRFRGLQRMQQGGLCHLRQGRNPGMTQPR